MIRDDSSCEDRLSKTGHIHVACAIIERDGFILAAQRSATMSMPLKWEFPGGKMDPGESPEGCLKREIDEELGIQVSVGRNLPVCTYRYPAFTISLYPFICAIERGEIVLHEHAAIAWLSPEKLHTLEWAEADVPVLASYLAQIKAKIR
ncbi:(deoxy)nucleoside triphosphate pyrophosphohydrolase [Desulfatirhabdium butyrativorans]|uniref:(deoxy)nucleoside triphosphate pyrophosphohydrolase n=1 Tax=Desulfatirhabdium butyrativorans TaxID=340467 RepID=UPI000428673E|nr:(deoxy)nucleoside triphosphate pyrophosphohydrolase [Desulfatirhabdium butyrativorans]